MRDTKLFELALGLTSPWIVRESAFDPDKGQVDIWLDFPRGARFGCPLCGRADCAVHDTFDKTWRHLNFFQHQTHLHARTPRVKCPTCGVKLVVAPWSRPGSGFTLLFEAFVMLLAKDMPVAAIARLVHEHDTLLWRILRHYTEQAHQVLDLSEVQAVGMDETASKRGQHYVSLFVDMDDPRVIFATAGRDARTLKAFSGDLQAHGGDPEHVEEVCCDMSAAFIAGVQKHLPQASITFDKYHVMKIINDALDQVRRHEQRQRPELKKTRYIWLKNRDGLKDAQAEWLATLILSQQNLKTLRAYHLKINFQELWDQAPEAAEGFLKQWYFWATHSRLEPMIEAARTIKRHWDGVLRWFKTGLTNGILEGIAGLVQGARARARGYRNIENFIAMIYIVAGKLNCELPT